MRAWHAVRERLWLGLGPQVIVLVMLAVLVTGGLIGSLVIKSSRSTVREDILGRNLGTADLAGNLVMNYVEGSEASLRQLALRPLFVSAVQDQDVEQAEWHMEQVMQIDPRFDNIAVYTADGVGWASGLKSKWLNRGGGDRPRMVPADARHPRAVPGNPGPLPGNRTPGDLLHHSALRRPGRTVRAGDRRYFPRRSYRCDHGHSGRASPRGRVSSTRGRGASSWPTSIRPVSCSRSPGRSSPRAGLGRKAGHDRDPQRRRVGSGRVRAGSAAALERADPGTDADRLRLP